MLGEAPPPGRWGVRERELLEFAIALSNRPAEAVDVLRPHFSDPEIVELVTLGAATVMLNRFATALELPS
jgi:alkylhydroperoxidase family enzyme